MRTASIALLFILAAGCKTLDKAALNAFETREIALMTELSEYLDADAKAGKLSPAQLDLRKAQIREHLAIVHVNAQKVSVDQQAFLMTDLIAHVQADPAKSAGKKKSEVDALKGHMDLFTSIHNF